MRRFTSYGPLDKDIHYYAPRRILINDAYSRLTGDTAGGDGAGKSGHYITVWAPRQTGKSWLITELSRRFQNNRAFDFVPLPLEHLKAETDPAVILNTIARELGETLGKSFTNVNDEKSFQYMFKRGALDKPLILVLDEFDALAEKGISAVVSAFRNIYTHRRLEVNKAAAEKTYWLHGVALIGVRSVLGVEDVKGSPFNVQQSLHIPNLTEDEVKDMFRWYEKESKQKIEPAVIEKILYETRGHPGLTCWFGELVSEGVENYSPPGDRPVDEKDFEKIFAAATYDLPNTTILNIIGKARKEPYKQLVLELFRTESKLNFSFDSPRTNYLYMHGVIDKEIAPGGERYIRFSCPFVQKRLFNYFSAELYPNVGQLYSPMTDLDTVAADDRLYVKSVLELYGDYLKNNSHWLFKEAPRRADMRIREAVFQFNLYAWLNEFLKRVSGLVYPEFPTGNGKVDLFIIYKGKRYALEVKSFSGLHQYREGLKQAAAYAGNLGLKEIHLVFFIETLDTGNRVKLETPYQSATGEVTVRPFFIETGAP